MDVEPIADAFDVFEDWGFGTKEVQAFGVVGVFFGFCDDVADRVFPSIDGFDFNQLGVGE